jgi:hypothetical protein
MLVVAIPPQKKRINADQNITIFFRITLPLYLNILPMYFEMKKITKKPNEIKGLKFQ